MKNLVNKYEEELKIKNLDSLDLRKILSEKE